MILKGFEIRSDIFVEWWKELALLFLTITIVIIVYVKYAYSYWERHGIFAEKASIPFGCMTDFLMGKRHIGEIVRDIYLKGKGQKYIGYYSFWTPTLLVRDPELIKRVLVKDFDHFFDRGMYFNEKDDPLSAHLFALNGYKWRNTRIKLNPTFSTGKIKQIYEVMKICSVELRELIIGMVNRNEEIDFKEVVSRHSVNVIANAAIGVEGHTLENESFLSNIAFMATAPTTIQGLRFILAMLSKDVASLFKMRFTPKEVERYYLDLTKEIVEKRSKSDVQRNDFMQLLYNMWDRNLSYDYQEKTENTNSLSLRDMAAQTFLFILAAYESTASAICFTLYELAKNPMIQEKLIEEIDTLGATEEVTYEQLLDLKYLDMVINETFRRYPAGSVLFRECQKPYTLPDGKILNKGITVAISSLGLHLDPEYFPDPEKYDPERYNKENPAQTITPFTFLPFGEGPRVCIGKRYGIVSTKITLFTLLSKFRYEMTDKTPDTIKIDPKIFVVQAKGGMHLKAIIRK